MRTWNAKKRGAAAARTLLAGLLALGIAGCSWPFRKHAPEEENPFGISDPRLRQMNVKDLDAQIAQPRSGLRLAIEADKADYSINEPIVVDVRLENVGNPQGPEKPRDISVYFEPVAQLPNGTPVEWLFRFELRADKGDQLIYQTPPVKVSDSERASYYHYVTLPPQSFVGRRFVFWPQRARGLLKPGRYNLLCSYSVGEDYPYVILNRNFTAAQVEMLGTKLAYTRVWTGQLYSNRTEFRIKRKRFLGIF